MASFTRNISVIMSERMVFFDLVIAGQPMAYQTSHLIRRTALAGNRVSLYKCQWQTQPLYFFSTLVILGSVTSIT
jgi:hypothetical protein